MKRAILVCGTGRSGTSVMTGSLQILGAILGTALKIGDVCNAKGYFENTDITDLNKALLAKAGITWYGNSLDTVCQLPVTDAVSTAIRSCVEQTFGEASPIAIKDPRLCVLIEAYVATLRPMGYEIHCVRMHRDPTEVTKSLAAATGTSAPRWLPQVAHHEALLDAALRRVGVTGIDCDFSDLVTDPAVTITRIVERLGFLTLSVGHIAELLSFIDSTLKHY